MLFLIDVIYFILVAATYNAFLVLLSFAISILATFVAFGLVNGEFLSAKWFDAGNSKFRFLKIAGAALFMGVAIWASLFVGISAINLPVTLSYNLYAGLMSLIPATLISWFALETLSRNILGKNKLIIVGLAIFVGIIAQFYTVRVAMQGNVFFDSNQILLAAVFIISSLLSVFSLMVKFSTNTWLSAHGTLRKFSAPLVFGGAITGMFYLSMAATDFVLMEDDVSPLGVEGIERLSFILVVAALAIALVAVVVSRIRSHFRSARDLQKQQLYLNTVLDTMVDGLIVISPQGNIRSANKSALEMFGYSEEELIGKNVKILIRGGVHDNHDQYLTNEKKTGMGSIIGSDLLCEVEGYNKKGQKLDLELAVNKTVINKEIFFVTSLRDVTKRTRVEKRMRQHAAIIENSLNEIYIIDPETFRIIDTNKSARNNIGYQADELKKMSILDIQPEFSRKSFAKLVASLKKGKPGKVHFETKHLRKDGTTYDVGANLQRATLVDKPVIVTILEDITTEKVAAEQMRRSQRMEAIGELAGGVAHDFNNLLTAIQGGLQLLEMSNPNMSKENRKYLDLARKSALRGADLTHRLLALSRSQPLQTINVEINKLITETLPLLKQSLGELIDVKFNKEKKDRFINVDASELENALLNIAINAAGAMPEGGTFTIKVGGEKLTRNSLQDKATKPGNYVSIALSDTGSGMSREVMGKIFEPFFTTKDIGKGTGLGLSMVYGFVKQSGGYIAVDSQPNQGTTFKIYFPEVKKAPEPNKKTTLTEISKTKQQGLILLVEDDKEVRDCLATALKIRGYTILEAVDGQNAITIMKKTKGIDLLLSDVVLPKGVLGPEVGLEFKKRFPGSPVLYMSGFSSKAVQERRFDLSKETLLRKPIGLEDLFQEVSEKISL